MTLQMRPMHTTSALYVPEISGRVSERERERERERESEGGKRG